MITALVGLGNEGEEYQKTYHNVGAFVAQQIADLAREEGVELKLYPVTGFMNQSGTPVRAWLKQNNKQLSDIVVIHDETDLPIGEFRLVTGGGSAGHKGIDDLVKVFGTNEFQRLRIGVRDPNEQVRQKAGEFVLTRWSAADEKLFVDIAKAAWGEMRA